jgi:hypothetical protein
VALERSTATLKPPDRCSLNRFLQSRPSRNEDNLRAIGTLRLEALCEESMMCAMPRC